MYAYVRMWAIAFLCLFVLLSFILPPCSPLFSCAAYCPVAVLTTVCCVDFPVNDRLVLLSSLAKPELTPAVMFKVRQYHRLIPVE